jgi:hypothetical protein
MQGWSNNKILDAAHKTDIKCISTIKEISVLSLKFNGEYIGNYYPQQMQYYPGGTRPYYVWFICEEWNHEQIYEWRKISHIRN